MPSGFERHERLVDIKKRYSNVILENAKKKPTKFVRQSVNGDLPGLKSLLDVFGNNAKQIGVGDGKNLPQPKFWKKKEVKFIPPPKQPNEYEKSKDEIGKIKGLYRACLDCFTKKI